MQEIRINESISLPINLTRLILLTEPLVINSLTWQRRVAIAKHNASTHPACNIRREAVESEEGLILRIEPPCGRIVQNRVGETSLRHRTLLFKYKFAIYTRTHPIETQSLRRHAKSPLPRACRVRLHLAQYRRDEPLIFIVYTNFKLLSCICHKPRRRDCDINCRALRKARVRRIRGRACEHASRQHESC